MYDARETGHAAGNPGRGSGRVLGEGIQRASLRSIVKAAGVTTGALYGYYGSKEALF